MVETEILVRFAETDAMGIVHHSNYLVYFEAARVTLSKAYGAPYSELEAAGYALAVVEATIRYATPARFDEVIRVQTWVEQIRSRGVTFGYKVVNASGDTTIATGTTRHICVDDIGRPARIPKRWITAMKNDLPTE